MNFSLYFLLALSANSAWQLLAALLVLAVTVFLLRRWRMEYAHRRNLEKNELERQVAQMEMKALRSQMNPHFIFNAINSIQHYVLTNEKELANKYLVKFSQLIRNILDLSKKELISLKDELETIQIYVDIESLRFNNAFEFQLVVDEGVELSRILLPPMLIQPFVENAIWHGLLLSQDPKKLFIGISHTSEGTRIVIDDNGIGREAASKFSIKELKRRSLGMDITNDRLGLFEKVFGIPVTYNVDDKIDSNGKSAGTRVVLNIKNKIVSI